MERDRARLFRTCVVAQIEEKEATMYSVVIIMSFIIRHRFSETRFPGKDRFVIVPSSSGRGVKSL